jgi:hypothetical protein
MTRKLTLLAYVAACSVIGSVALAQDATTSGTGNTGNQNNNPAAVQQGGTGTAGGDTTGGTGNTGNANNDPAAVQNCPSGQTAMKNAAGQMACQ